MYEVLNSAGGLGQNFPAWPAIPSQLVLNSPGPAALVGPGQRVPTYNVFICSSIFFLKWRNDGLK